MSLLEKLGQRADLMGQMAETLGVDFAARIAANPAMAGAVREGTMRCGQCSHDSDCKGWMADHDHADQTPDYCRNKALLEGLAKA